MDDRIGLELIHLNGEASQLFGREITSHKPMFAEVERIADVKPTYRY